MLQPPNPYPAAYPMIMLRFPVLSLCAALKPRIIFSQPEVSAQAPLDPITTLESPVIVSPIAIWRPMKTLESPVSKSLPARYPNITL